MKSSDTIQVLWMEGCSGDRVRRRYFLGNACRPLSAAYGTELPQTHRRRLQRPTKTSRFRATSVEYFGNRNLKQGYCNTESTLDLINRLSQSPSASPQPPTCHARNEYNTQAVAFSVPCHNTFGEPYASNPSVSTVFSFNAKGIPLSSVPLFKTMPTSTLFNFFKACQSPLI